MIKEIALRKLASAGSYLTYKNGETDGRMYGGGLGTVLGGIGGRFVAGKYLKSNKLRLAGTLGGALIGNRVGSGIGGDVGGSLSWLRDKGRSNTINKKAGTVGGAVIGGLLGGIPGAIVGGFIGNRMSKKDKVNEGVVQQMQEVSLNTSKAPSNTSTLSTTN